MMRQRIISVNKNTLFFSNFTYTKYLTYLNYIKHMKNSTSIIFHSPLIKRRLPSSNLTYISHEIFRIYSIDKKEKESNRMIRQRIISEGVV